MKDTLITGRRKKIELITLLVCFVIANLINLYAIIVYDKTSFVELFTSIGYVLAASLFIYIIWSVVRIIIYGIKQLIQKPKR